MKLFKLFGRGDDEDLEDDLIDLEPLDDDMLIEGDDIGEGEVGAALTEALDDKDEDGDGEDEPEVDLFDDDQESLSQLTDDDDVFQEEVEETEDTEDTAVEEDSGGLKVQHLTVEDEQGEVKAAEVDDIMDLFTEEEVEQSMPEFVLNQLVDIQASDLLKELSQVRNGLARGS
jgi:hypothetical protein